MKKLSTLLFTASGNHVIEIRECTLWAWGRNDFGQLGNGTTVNKNTSETFQL